MGSRGGIGAVEWLLQGAWSVEGYAGNGSGVEGTAVVRHADGVLVGVVGEG